MDREKVRKKLRYRGRIGKDSDIFELYGKKMPFGIVK